MSTADNPELVIGYQLALEVGLNPTTVLRITRAQRGQSEANRRRVESALGLHPEVRVVMDGKVQRLAWRDG